MGNGWVAAGRGQVSARQQVTSLTTVDTTDEGFLVVQTTHEKHLLTVGLERFEHLAEFHVLPFALGHGLIPILLMRNKAMGRHSQTTRCYRNVTPTTGGNTICESFASKLCINKHQVIMEYAHTLLFFILKCCI